MLEEVSRLSGLVDNLTEPDRISRGYELSPEPVLCEVLIQKAVSSVQGMAERNSFSVKTGVERDLGYVYADPGTIQQVFSNLLSNAIRYTPKQGVIEVGARRHSPSQVLFWVRDSGPGINENDISRIFERFYREIHREPGLQVAQALGLQSSRPGGKFRRIHLGRESPRRRRSVLFHPSHL